MPTVSDSNLIKGLQSELKSNRDLQIDWYTAVGLLTEKKKKGGDWARVEEHDVALIAFGLTNFYAEFNEVRHGVSVSSNLYVRCANDTGLSSFFCRPQYAYFSFIHASLYRMRLLHVYKLFTCSHLGRLFQSENYFF